MSSRVVYMCDQCRGEARIPIRAELRYSPFVGATTVEHRDFCSVDCAIAWFDCARGHIYANSAQGGGNG